ncbi:uncharacterized protein LOC141613238 [Silene latifolia]|uniref:uncharacterized protein LOC141613238 n=1 Tax=Silene latifolia TaxID=37657 RepID=UPI003D7831A3
MKYGFTNGQWSATQGEYQVSSGYQWLMGQQQAVQWYPMVWSRTIIPRHAFIGWLVMQERLITRDRLLSFGVITEAECVICSNQTETHAHLIYECMFSRQCWDLLSGWFGISFSRSNVVDWFLKWRCPSLMKKQIVGAAMVALWYHIWNARNITRLEAKVMTPRYILMQVKHDIQLRCRERRWTLKAMKLPWEPSFL